jgi:probable F420-dependent oxidoreductase
MDVGIVHVTGSGIRPDVLARAVEERGFESLFYAEHTHIPVATTRADGRSGRDYANTFDPFVALAAAAAVTSRIRLGTAVCLLPQRDPITTAKEVASLDLVSDGRIELGVGPGWNQLELANHSVDPATRTARMRDAITALRAIWTDEAAEQHGPFVDFDPMWSWPKPVQDGGPPVLLGGNGPGAERRVIAYGDGWLPQYGLFADLAEVRARVARLRSAAADAGREHLPVTVFGVAPDAARLHELADVGVDRCLLPIRSEAEDDPVRTLDEYTAVRDAFGGLGN